MALDKIIADLPKNGGRNILEVVEELRKSLLTRKVTKWFDVYQHGDSFNMSTCLWDSKAAAENDPSPYRIGTYPIEVPQKPPVKKVWITKWAMVTSSVRGSKDVPTYSVYGDLQDEKISAEEIIVSSSRGEHIVGVFPVEIEVPL
jgi:hypothetical protein